LPIINKARRTIHHATEHPMSSLELNPAKTALVLIDLQQGIVNMVPAGGADAVLANAAQLAARFRALGSPVVLVKVAFPAGPAALRLLTDTTLTLPPAMPAGWDTHVAAIGSDERDIIVTKRQWGAFYGTDLDLQLRRRGIDTIVLGGIATNFGVESTARAANELGYHQVFAEDAMRALDDEGHKNTVARIFPRLGRVRGTAQVIAAAA
jgi:nicotinamidase-related amidase